MAYIVLNTIKDYKISKTVYKMLRQEAEINHNLIKQEMNNRLLKTLDPKYNYSGDERLMNMAIKKLNIKPQMKFDLNIPKILRPTIDIIKQYRPNADDLNYEINLRIAYTLCDPFYYI